MRLAELGEFGLIDRMAALVKPRAGVSLGIGDDAAVLVPGSGLVSLVTADMLVEGIHFSLDWSDPFRLGRKSLAVNLSDIAAMGGVPRFALLSLAIPASTPVEFMDRFIAGFLEQAEQFGVSLVGGDTCASASGLVVSVTLLGEQSPAWVVTRGAACPGDLVCITGTVGDAAVGLELLKGGRRDGESIRRHLDPEPRVALGRALAEAALPTAMIDVSDGLAADLGHILSRSGRGGRLDLDKLPLSPSFLEDCGTVAADPFTLALGGGEDYELLFTLPEAKCAAAFALGNRCGVAVTVIGSVTAGSGLVLTRGDGQEYCPASSGYNHFMP